MAENYLIICNIDNATIDDHKDIVKTINKQQELGNIKRFTRISIFDVAYAIHTKYSMREIINLFRNARTVRTHVMVVKYIDSEWFLPSNDSNNLSAHNF